MFLSIIIPAYNEANIIEETIDKVHKYFVEKKFEFEIIVVDDGSDDDTSLRVKKKEKEFLNVRLFCLPKNLGKGGAVKAGALASKGEWMLFMDADLSSQPEEFDKFSCFLNSHDIVIGSRCLPDSVIKVHQPKFREITGRILNKLFYLTLKLPFADTQCGFKIFHRRTISLFEAQALTRWLFEVEVLYLGLRQNFNIKEVPIVWAHDPITKVKFSDGLRILYDLWKIKQIHS